VKNVLTLEMRYRAKAEETIAERHDQIVRGLAEVGPPWGIKNGVAVPGPDTEGSLVVQVNLTPYLGLGIAGGLLYKLRSSEYLRDEAEFDDLLLLEIDSTHVDYRSLVQIAFPAYVQAFTPYRGTIVLDQQLSADEWPEIVRLGAETGRDVDGRDGVYRINPVSYFDRELCLRAFNLAPEEIVAQLQGKVESASILLDGVLLVATSELIRGEELTRVGWAIRDLLAVR
jgi:hypothetical protein